MSTTEITETTVRRRMTAAGADPSWRTWGLVGLLCLTAYSTAVGWLAQIVVYPLFREMPADVFAGYHRAYNRFIPAPVIGPGFVTFLAAIAFWWTRPGWVSRRAAAVVAVTGAVSIATTVLWAIPKHDQLDRDGQAGATIDSLLQANLLRTTALTVGTLTLGWHVGRRLARGAGG